ncbi:hypothetical protein [Microvirga sp. M2]|uniref:hypothetical protein n=1 Tax=Microvirga sp. M2 TaxID=3073270 RepID=UPI0039C3849A
MADPVAEREHLARAERDIAEGERRVTRQTLLVEELRRDGRDTGEAERHLLILQETLASWYSHRDLILQELARHEPFHPHR